MMAVEQAAAHLHDDSRSRVSSQLRRGKQKEFEVTVDSKRPVLVLTSGRHDAQE